MVRSLDAGLGNSELQQMRRAFAQYNSVQDEWRSLEPGLEILASGGGTDARA